MYIACVFPMQAFCPRGSKYQEYSLKTIVLTAYIEPRVLVMLVLGRLGGSSAVTARPGAKSSQGSGYFSWCYCRLSLSWDLIRAKAVIVVR